MAETATAECLSDDQIEQLLREAEERLKAKHQGQDEKAVAVPNKSDVVKASKPDFPAPKVASLVSSKDKSKSEGLSVRVPEVRRPKQEMVRRTSILYGLYTLLSARPLYDEIHIPI